MHNQGNQDVIKEEIIDRIDIFDYLRCFLHDLSIIENHPVEVKTDFDALRLKGLMNNPKNTRFKSAVDLTSGQPYWKYQDVEYIPSNLGKGRGFIFYFICYSCEKKAKYLYFTSYLEPPVCRKCCRLPYRQSYKQRKMAQKRNRTTWVD